MPSVFRPEALHPTLLLGKTLGLVRQPNADLPRRVNPEMRWTDHLEDVTFQGKVSRQVGDAEKSASRCSLYMRNASVYRERATTRWWSVAILYGIQLLSRFVEQCFCLHATGLVQAMPVTGFQWINNKGSTAGYFWYRRFAKWRFLEAIFSGKRMR
jgi:hypothetical protein